MKDASVKETVEHIKEVQIAMEMIVTDLTARSIDHDKSKFDPIEKGPLDAVALLILSEGRAPYGTDEYKRRTEMLRPMLDHHYAVNDHHPEHYENGIAGMSLMSLVEMFADWRAANIQRDNGAPMNLSFSIERLKIEPQLAEILRNTARQLGWDFK